MKKNICDCCYLIDWNTDGDDEFRSFDGELADIHHLCSNCYTLIREKIESLIEQTTKN